MGHEQWLSRLYLHDERATDCEERGGPDRGQLDGRSAGTGPGIWRLPLKLLRQALVESHRKKMQNSFQCSYPETRILIGSLFSSTQTSYACGTNFCRKAYQTIFDPTTTNRRLFESSTSNLGSECSATNSLELIFSALFIIELAHS